jgi:hypothetical protein
MQILLRFLLYKIKSVDGVPGTLDGWVKKLTKKDKSNVMESPLLRKFSTLIGVNNISDEKK